LIYSVIPNKRIIQFWDFWRIPTKYITKDINV